MRVRVAPHPRDLAARQTARQVQAEYAKTVQNPEVWMDVVAAALRPVAATHVLSRGCLCPSVPPLSCPCTTTRP